MPHTINLAGKDQPIQFNMHAVMTLERLAGESLTTIQPKLQTAALGWRGVLWFLVAALEGGRIGYGIQRDEWTVMEVGRAITNPGTYFARGSPAMTALDAAWAEAFPTDAPPTSAIH